MFQLGQQMPEFSSYGFYVALATSVCTTQLYPFNEFLNVFFYILTA